jgi:uncharacterized protein
VTPDINILIAASRSDHAHHAVARAWLLETLALGETGRPLRLLPMVLAGFLRLVTFDKNCKKLLTRSQVTVLTT